MGKLGNISGREAAKAFAKSGRDVVGQVGSHLVLTKPGQRANLSVPQTRNCRWVRSARWFERLAWQWTSSWSSS